ncbi:MAG: hypothetical protein AAF850_13390, partial [Pseudomonadota bacterium]
MTDQPAPERPAPPDTTTQQTAVTPTVAPARTDGRHFDGQMGEGQTGEGQTGAGRGSGERMVRTGRVKFSGVVEAESTEPTPGGREPTGDEDIIAVPIKERRKRDWNRQSRQVRQATRLGALMIFSAMVLGWPIGAALSHGQIYGSMRGWWETLLATLDPGIIVFTIFAPLLILFCGYFLSHAYKMLNAADSIAAAAARFAKPPSDANAQAAIDGADAVGEAVQTQLTALNAGIDESLALLAQVEAMIRNHVNAIEAAGVAIEERATTAVDRVASERTRLITLTENLNEQADDFAAAIAERARVSAKAVDEAGQASMNA